MRKKNYDIKIFLTLCVVLWLAYVVREISLAAFN